MTGFASIEISYRFEHVPQGASGGDDIAQLSRNVTSLASVAPWAIPGSSLGTSARAASGELPRFESSPRNVRLRAIQGPQGPLVEHAYDSVGRLCKSAYMDGVTVEYFWDDSRLESVRWSSGQFAKWSRRRDGSMDSAEYPGSQRFTNDYNKGGAVVRRTYPDGLAVAFQYESKGDLSGVTADSVNFIPVHSATSEFPWSVHYKGKHYTAIQAKQSCTVEWLADGGRAGAEQPFVGPLGIWKYIDGRLCDMFLPTGERYRHIKTRDTIAVWTVSGQTTFYYASSGQLGAAMQSDGTRWIINKLPNGPFRLLVGPQSVALHEHDAKGRVIRIRNSDGSFSMFKYSRTGHLQEIRTAEGWLRFECTTNGKLRTVSSSIGWQAEFDLTDTGGPIATTLSSDEPAIYPGCAMNQLGHCVWQWETLQGFNDRTQESGSN